MAAITVAGTILADKIKIIDRYPSKGELAHIKSSSMGVGGCVPNTAITLASLGGATVRAVGCIGQDNTAEYIKSQLVGASVDISGLKEQSGVDTSYTDVMTVESTGERTFFNTSGANAFFGPEDLVLKDTAILHIGYLMLLEKFDLPDEEFGTVMARCLAKVQQRGIKTSIDTVSGESQRLKSLVLPSLKFCDFAILNEIEAGHITGLMPRDNKGQLNIDNIRKILHGIVGLGAKRAIIHCPEGGFCLTADGRYSAVPSLELPKGYIKGAVGAGDAFAAGILYAYHNGADDHEALTLASCTAAANLAVTDSISGARSYERTIALKDQFSQRKEFVI